MSELPLGTLNSKAIVAMLAARHSEDVFVPECKDGPTWGSGHFRLDAWAMKRSWAHPCVTGYEIKVNRSDFLRDDKWPAYLSCCNQLYFVCPHGLIQPQEIGQQAGLLWASKQGAKLFVKRKAEHRTVDIPETVFRYILMSRARIVPANFYGRTREERLADWRQWLANKEERRHLGYAVSKAIREHVEKVDSDNVRLRNENDTLREQVLPALQALGYRPDDLKWVNSYHVKAKIAALKELVPSNIIKLLEQSAELTASVAKKLREHMQTGGTNS